MKKPKHSPMLELLFDLVEKADHIAFRWGRTDEDEVTENFCMRYERTEKIDKDSKWVFSFSTEWHSSIDLSHKNIDEATWDGREFKVINSLGHLTTIKFYEHKQIVLRKS